MVHGRIRLAAVLVPAGLAFAATCGAAGDDMLYGLDYRIRLVPEDDLAKVSVEIGDNADLVRAIRFNIVPGRHTDFSGDGKIDLDGTYVHWTPPAAGGGLAFSAAVDHERTEGAYDAMLTGEWAIFRGDDMVPPARVRTVKGAEARARLRLTAPDGWSVVSPYREDDRGWAPVEHADRRFDRPTGWMAAGRMGVRRERIRGIQVTVAGPVNHGVRRMDMLAFMNWNLPEILRVFDDFPERMLIVSAGDPMWRGGLSGPASLFLHADRPLISENGTSPLLHEVMHATLGIEAARDHDWIVEGLAEFYSVEIMRRSGTISRRRYERGYDQLRRWSEEPDVPGRRPSKGTITARAVLVMRKVDEEIRDRTDGDRSLDDVAREIASLGDRITFDRFREIGEKVAGAPLRALGDGPLPGVD
ncbi:MAG TPA: hypothetical protein VM616_05045 [Gammaproteobacteria bacterium]|nr:hypothetical protein [Gammaproteobacteria bacterium]